MDIKRGLFNGLVKDVDTEGRTVTGYFAAFHNKDTDGDVIIPGAFTKSVKERGPEGKGRIFHLWQHWTSDILGKPHVLKEDAHGLYFESKIAKTTLGNDVLQLYLDGIVNEHSIGFNVIQSEKSEEENTVTIKEVRLWEGSTVTWGANENTPSTGVKSASKQDLQKHVERINKAFKSGTYTDDTFELLQIELNLISDLLKSLEGPEIPPTKEPTVEELIEAFTKGLK